MAWLLPGSFATTPLSRSPSDSIQNLWEEDSRRRTYRLTAFGREVLRAETERLTELVGTAIAKQVIPATALGDGK